MVAVARKRFAAPSVLLAMDTPTTAGNASPDGGAGGALVPRCRTAHRLRRAANNRAKLLLGLPLRLLVFLCAPNALDVVFVLRLGCVVDVRQGVCHRHVALARHMLVARRANKTSNDLLPPTISTPNFFAYTQKPVRGKDHQPTLHASFQPAHMELP